MSDCPYCGSPTCVCDADGSRDYLEGEPDRLALALAREPGWNGAEYDANEAAQRLLAYADGETDKLRTALRELDEADDLLREIANVGVVAGFSGYVEVQIDRATWEALAPYRGSREGGMQ